MQRGKWNSRIARRLMLTFVALVGLPLVATVVIVGRIARDQTVWIGHTTEQINSRAVQDAAREFQSLGGRAVDQTGRQAADISIKAVQAVSTDVERAQADSLAATARDVATLTNSSFDGALRHSVATNRATLGTVRDQTADLVGRASRDSQNAVGTSVEAAMLEVIRSLMQERADNLAHVVSEHVQDHLSYLSLTAQMPDLKESNLPSEKPILDALVRKYPMFTEVAVTDTTGQETAMSAVDRLVTREDLRSHPGAAYVQTALQGERYIGVEPGDSSSGPPNLRLAVPIELYRGKVVGVLTAKLSLVELWDTLSSTRIGKQGYVCVLDSANKALMPRPRLAGAILESSSPVEALGWRVVAAQPRAEVAGPIAVLKADIARSGARTVNEMRARIQASSLQAATRMHADAGRLRALTAVQLSERTHQVFDRLKQTTSMQTRDSLGKMRGAIAERSRQTQAENNGQMRRATDAASERVRTRVQMLVDEALHRADARLSLSAAFILLVSCLVSCVLAVVIAQRFVRPLTSLAQAAEAVAKGDFDGRVPDSAPDEIGDLARTFNAMTYSLQQSRSDLHEAEAQLVQSAKLASLGTLSAGVAHELNQPLAIIRGITQQMRALDGMPDGVMEDLELVEGQTSRMMKIIKHLRTFSRVGTVERAAVDVNQIVRDCFILVGEQLRAHSIEVELDLCEEAAVVWADGNELEQVFLNLITNARDALDGRDGARIRIATVLEDGDVRLDFRDNGPGIPPDVAARVFDPFFTTKEPDKGTGLGLSISHSIIRKHHGTIEVASDGGAVFTIVLPTGLPRVTTDATEEQEAA